MWILSHRFYLEQGPAKTAPGARSFGSYLGAAMQRLQVSIGWLPPHFLSFCACRTSG